MKKIVLALSLGLALSSVSAQFLASDRVPESVRVEFNRQFPKAKSITWTPEQKGYQASFETHYKKYFVSYDNEGHIIDQTIELDKIKLPRNIRRKIERNYGDFIIEATYRIDSKNGSDFIVELGRSEEGIKLLFNPQGNLLSISSLDGSLTRR